MRFNLFYDGELEEKGVDVSQLLRWLSELRFDLPDDVFVNIHVEEGDEL